MITAVAPALVAGALGIGLATWLLRLLLELAPLDLPRSTEIGIDRGVLAFALAVSVIAGVLTGLIPIFGSGAPASQALRDSNTRGGAPCGAACTRRSWSRRSR